MSAPYPTDFKGAAQRLADIDLPTLGARIGVGEDEIHAVLDVESRGHGFDASGRPLILFEPHLFFRFTSGTRREAAVRAGLAYPTWGEKPYPKDSYPRLIAARKIDETAALRACSWGLMQVLGDNFAAAGFLNVQTMVGAMCAGEREQLSAAVSFIRANRLDAYLRAHQWDAFARGYNGPNYLKNDYANRLRRRFAYWSKVPDTPFPKSFARTDALSENKIRDDVTPHVVGAPAAPLAPGGGSSGGAGASGSWTQPDAPAPAPAPAPATPAPRSAWRRFLDAFSAGVAK